MPNNVRNAIVERIKFFQDPNSKLLQDIYGKLENRPYWNWQFGTIDELGKLLNIKSC